MNIEALRARQREITRIAQARGSTHLRDSEDAEFRDLADRISDAERRQGSRAAAGRIHTAAGGRTGRETLRYTGGNEVYSERSNTSFVRDLINSAIPGRDPRGEARRRLEQHSTDAAELEQRTPLNTTLGTGGGFVPPHYLLDLYAPLARAGKPLLNLIPEAELPPTMSVSIPRLIAGSSVTSQVSQNTSVTEVDIQDGYVTGNVVTLAGNQTVSLQLLEQSPIAFDAVVFQDLFAAHAQVSDAQAITGTGTNGQLLGLANIPGIEQISFPSASTQGIYSALAQAINLVWTTRFAAPDYIVIHPTVWAEWLSKLDSENRPLFIPRYQGAFNAAGIMGNNNAEGIVGNIMGLQVVLDPNIPYSAGTSSAYVIKSTDLMYFTSGAQARVLYEPLGAQLSVLLQCFSFSTLISRYPSSIVQITGYTPTGWGGS